MEQSSTKKTGIIIAVVIILGLFATALFAGKRDDDSPNTSSADIVNTPVTTPVSTPTTKPTTTPTTQPADTKKTVYKNGTYSATGTYMSPGGQDKLGVKLTIVNDIVTDATVTAAAGDNTSARYQEKFIAGYKQYVIGKNIDTISMTRVSGASLTPLGFTDALAQIKIKAKA